ncbi:DedA family protein [Paenactinomyces guangxiensis]|uniref:VTT domain-containing protein n=1 Tax=Paenactinomyces guangxiensis TaxID=1490290 RepID=A0A7W2A7E7_9BACL|nr:VTT domain-containing protein [Paenactinomyces guangxiensis]MBA4493069.1 VTT domain-containing protein [Paenactinomyces guangxiensis]MBH8590081.1 VTT domain-containing protein [Paenactinomyces guangxiensis]
MLQFALDFLEKCGPWGLFAATAIEASSVPFPGAMFVLIYGYLFQVGPWQLVLLGALNSAVYTLFSLIPFYLGYKIENFSKKKLDQSKVEKVQLWFKKYGEWTIIFSRPTSFGNYISYISGLSRIKPWRFILFTYFGVFPWNTLLLFIGNLGSLDTVQRFLDVSQKFGTILAVAVILIALTWYVLRREKQKQNCEKG